MMITRRTANRPIPITITGTIVRITRGQPRITIIIQVAATPARAHPRQHGSSEHAATSIIYPNQLS